MERIGILCLANSKRWEAQIMTVITVSRVGEVKNGIEYTCSFPRMAFREPGVYIHKDAVGELIPIHKNGKTSVYRVNFHSKNLKDAQELLQEIMKGNIRPEPKNSYARPPNGPSYEEMRTGYDAQLALIRKAEEERDKAIAEISELRKSHDILLGGFNRLSIQRSAEREMFCHIEATLKGKIWPYVSASKVAKSIRFVLYGKDK